MPDIHFTRRQLLAIQWASDTQLNFLRRLHAEMVRDNEPEEDVTAIDEEIELVNDVLAGVREVL